MNNLQQTIEKIYNNTPDNINGVMLGYKYVNNIKTDTIAVIYNVAQKKPLSELSPEEIIPKSLSINNNTYPTDVIEDRSTIRMLTCYTNYSSDAEILRLQGSPSLLTPIKGGQEIIQFPTSWIEAPGGGYNASIGTLGLIAVDNEDDRIVGVTNAHVACKTLLRNSQRSAAEKNNPYNLYESSLWVDNQSYTPGALVRNGSNLIVASNYLKRYSSYSNNSTNYVDVCLFGFNSGISNLIDNSSYQVHQPTTIGQTLGYLPFASTSEINNLLTTPGVNLYSTGRTTGPKGWGSTSSCKLVVDALFVSAGITSDDDETYSFADLIRYRYEDNSNFPSAGGDSGSAVLANINGTVKVIGLLFAGNGGSLSEPNPGTHYAFACRIDRIVSDMNIRAWNSSYTIKNTPPTAQIKTAYFDSQTSDDLTRIIDGEKYWNIGLTKNTQFDIVN